MSSILEIKDLNKKFGGLVALDNISINIEEKTIHGIIGPNGSGKSTLFNVISGIYKCDSGSIRFQNKELTKMPPHKIAKCGLARSFQLLRIWPDMTVLENLLVGHHCHIKRNIGGILFHTPGMLKEEKRAEKEMLDLLDFVGMADFANMQASETSIGQRRLISIARAMAMKPTLLMLDEPGAGLSPTNVDNIMNIIRRLHKTMGITLIVVEHILKVIMDTCSMVSVLDYGVKIAEDKSQKIKNNHKVIEAYLGQEMADDKVKEFFQS